MPSPMALLQPTYALKLPSTLHSDRTDDEAFLNDILQQIEDILKDNEDIDCLHVFTHAGSSSDPKGESNRPWEVR